EAVAQLADADRGEATHREHRGGEQAGLGGRDVEIAHDQRDEGRVVRERHRLRAGHDAGEEERRRPLRRSRAHARYYIGGATRDARVLRRSAPNMECIEVEVPEKENSTMPNITVQWYAGRTDQQRREITAAITHAMVTIGKTTADLVHIQFPDVDKYN